MITNHPHLSVYEIHDIKSSPHVTGKLHMNIFRWILTPNSFTSKHTACSPNCFIQLLINQWMQITHVFTQMTEHHAKILPHVKYLHLYFYINIHMKTTAHTIIQKSPKHPVYTSLILHIQTTIHTTLIRYIKIIASYIFMSAHIAIWGGGWKSPDSVSEHRNFFCLHHLSQSARPPPKISRTLWRILCWKPAYKKR